MTCTSVGLIRCLLRVTELAVNLGMSNETSVMNNPFSTTLVCLSPESLFSVPTSAIEPASLKMGNSYPC